MDRTKDELGKDEPLPVTYIPGERPLGFHDTAEFHQFTREQIDFLTEYAKTLDRDVAAKELGLSKAKVTNWLDKPGIQEEMMEIHRVWMRGVRMTGKAASAKLLDLMDKLEADYDQMADGDKSKMANALMKGVDSYMRASGQYLKEEKVAQSGITINIDLGGSLPEREAPNTREVQGEVIEHEDDE